MRKRRRKRGRPATGRDPVAPVRVPARTLRQIDKVAKALSCDRSKAMRWLLEVGLESGRALLVLRTSKGRTITDQITATYAADVRASAAEQRAAVAPISQKLEAEIKALRAREDQIERLETVVSRTTHPDRKMPTAYKPKRQPRQLTKAQIKAAADRAERLSKV